MSEFERLYTQQFQTVYRFLLSLSQDVALAEELTQETFYRAMKGLAGFDRRSKASTWLCQIAKNAYYDAMRRQRRAPPEPTPGETAGRDGLSALLAREDQRAIHRTLHALPEPYKEVFTLRVFAELGYQQIAALFDRSENWARVTFYRAKERLKQAMEENDND